MTGQSSRQSANFPRTRNVPSAPGGQYTVSAGTAAGDSRSSGAGSQGGGEGLARGSPVRGSQGTGARTGGSAQRT